jgi:hypothetical protein
VRKASCTYTGQVRKAKPAGEWVERNVLPVLGVLAKKVPAFAGNHISLSCWVLTVTTLWNILRQPQNI